MIHTLIIYSEQARNFDTSPSNNLEYVFDWSVLPQYKKYKVRFTFNSTMDTFTMDDIISIEVGFTGSPNTYEIDEVNHNRRYVSNCIGFAYPVYGVTATNSRLFAGVNDNLPICLGDRPSNNIFTVKLGNLDDSIALSYVLTLSFEEMN